ncbi:hypothetical protein KR50_21030 [Jeotgalibacillus campisalis]|uniref:Uncharacterized protein n=1 Tax=Jeotgalibacillus campisalis TaxID=220754 RepID=A0A0C2VU36_9BACL|nr:hypothetical protein KR50_21030 [Jeotgalibacillus campisalis]
MFRSPATVIGCEPSVPTSNWFQQDAPKSIPINSFTGFHHPPALLKKEDYGTSLLHRVKLF